MSIYCLFVGINHYKSKSINNLGGCENDVSAIQSVLKERFNIADINMLSLLDENASRVNILESFDSHLGQAQEGDTALFYYSGHGSQERANQHFWAINKGSSFNETLVCHDSRVNDDDYDLADKELRYLINKISKNKPRIITIIDSCHSGGASRGIEDDNINDEQVRQTPGSDAIRPIESYVFYEKAIAEGWLDDMSQLREGDHIEMSACRNTQLSKEKYVGRTKHGVFTYYLQQTLKYTHDLPSYRNLNAIVSQKVQGTVSLQHPQVDAVGDTDINKLFLADKIEPPKNQLYFKNGEWWINVGLAQGINKGAMLLITLEKKKNGSPEETSEAKVIEVLHDKSRIQISNNIALNTQTQYQTLMTDPAISRLPISFITNDDQLQQLRAELTDNKLLEENEPHSEYQIKSVDSACYKLSRVSGFPIFAPIATIQEVLQQAEKMLYWKRALNLAYAAGDLPSDSVKVVIEQQNHSDHSFSTIDAKDSEVNLNYQRLNGDWQKPVIKINLQLNTDTSFDENKLYISLLFLDSLTGQISILANNVNLIKESQIVWDGNSRTEENERRSFEIKSKRNNEFRLSVDNRLLEQGINKTTDYLKLIITNFENDMSSFQQSGFIKDERTPACGGSGSNGRGMDDDYYSETSGFIPKASTQTITLNTISPLKTEKLSDGTIRVSDSVRILPHKMDSGIELEEYSTDSASSVTSRGIDLPRTNPPDVFKNTPNSHPLSLTAHNGLDSAPTRIRIDLAQTRSVDSVEVSKNNPLIIEVDQKLNDNEQILPYTLDGEFYIPLGYAKRISDSDSEQEKTHILIEEIPESASAIDGETAKSIGGSIYVFLQKIVFDKLKLEHDTTRLAIPQFDSINSLSVDSYEDSQDVLLKKVAEAKRVLLFVHGIMGDTKTMAGSINAKLADGKTIGDGYDVVLTFDYENLNTPISETAEALIKKLAQLGLDDSHTKQLDIVAHSMGGLVSRWMIEKNPATPKVNKLVMLGTPNGGSPLRDLKQWTLGTLTLVLNGIAETKVVGFTVSALAKILDSMDDTLDEMDKNSKTLKFLYEAKDPKVPYYMIAGDTKNIRIKLDDDASKFSRFMTFLKERGKLAIADLFTDKLFGEANDIAVAQESMLHIPKNRHYALEVAKIDCDHISYFVEEDSLNELEKALRNLE